MNDTIFEAIVSRNLDAVKGEISNGADMNALCEKGGNKGATPLLVATLGNSWMHRPIINALIDAGASINTVDKANAWTCLHYATNLLIRPSLITLLTRGADPNIKDSVGRTPLSYCGMKGENMLLFPLIFSGADPSVAATNDKHTPATYAAMEGGIEIGDIYMTLEKGVKNNKELFGFFKSIMIGNKEEFEAKIKTYAKASLEYGETPLMAAAIAGRKEMSEELIRGGADVNAKNDKGRNSLSWSAMQWAAIFANSNVIEVLADNAGDVNIVDSIGNTPLINALLDYQDLETIKTLMKRGASIDIKNNFGETPLYAAVRGSNLEAVTVLVEAGANLLSITNDGGPLTHSAARTSNPEIIKYIVSKGVALEAAGPDGWQGIHVACEAGNLEALKIFIEAGADKNAKTNDGKTPLDIAQESGFQELISFLSK